MKNRQDHPGVYVPPPLIYVALFLLSVFIQKVMPINDSFFHSDIHYYIGYGVLITSAIMLLPALFHFSKTKNTLITIKPANSLQTNGIYAITRNPMYIGLLLIYTGVALLKGNWWTVLFIPVIIMIIQSFVIKKEEQYLERAFGSSYTAYKEKVRRWI